MKLASVLGPNVWVMGTSAASRPWAIRTRPIRGTLLRASKVYHRPQIENGYGTGQIHAKRGLFEPEGNPSEKALANPVKRAHGWFMHNNRAGSGPFAEAYRHGNALAAGAHRRVRAS